MGVLDTREARLLVAKCARGRQGKTRQPECVQIIGGRRVRSPGSLAPLRALACAPNYSTRLLCATKADGGPPASTSTRAFLLLRWHPGVDAVRLRLSVARADQQYQQHSGLEHMEQVSFPLFYNL